MVAQQGALFSLGTDPCEPASSPNLRLAAFPQRPLSPNWCWSRREHIAGVLAEYFEEYEDGKTGP